MKPRGNAIHFFFFWHNQFAKLICRNMKQTKMEIADWTRNLPNSRGEQVENIVYKFMILSPFSVLEK